METNKTTTSPDALIEDENSKAFYILRDESVALCKFKDELPYHKNRQTYLASGRFSPKYRTVLFWPESINTLRAIQLLIENNHIDSDYTFRVSGQATVTKGETKKRAPMGVDRHGGVRRAEIDTMLKKGFKLQPHVKSAQRRSEETEADQGGD